MPMHTCKCKSMGNLVICLYIFVHLSVYVYMCRLLNVYGYICLLYEVCVATAVRTV